jgi:hypothetical protein
MRIKAQEKLITIVIGFIILFLFTGCSAEKRIYDYSYTDSWYYEQNQRYQVYQTARGTKYILVLNKKETKIIRKYIKPLKNK